MTADLLRSNPYLLRRSSYGKIIHHSLLHATQQFHLQKVDGHALDPFCPGLLSPHLFYLPHHLPLQTRSRTLEFQTHRHHVLSTQMHKPLQHHRRPQRLAHCHRRLPFNSPRRHALARADEVVHQIPRLDHRSSGLRQYCPQYNQDSL